MDKNEWLNKWIKPITLNNDIFTKINSGNDYVHTFKPGAWTVIKELLLAYYAPQYLIIMRKQKWIKKLCYIDLFAGSGIITLTRLKNNYLGSPLIVKYAVEGNFDNYYFFEQKNDNINQLRALVQDDHSWIYEGDSNIEINRIIPEISKSGVHSLIFIDPFSTQIKFETIRKLNNIGCDLIINVDAEGIKRVIRQHKNTNWKTPALDNFFGDINWKTRFAENDDEEEIFNYYSDKIVKEAGKKKPVSTIVYKTLNGHNYYLLFTSTWGNGERPKFFNIIDDFNKQIRNLDGKTIMEFIKHNIEGKSNLDVFY